MILPRASEFADSNEPHSRGEYRVLNVAPESAMAPAFCQRLRVSVPVFPIVLGQSHGAIFPQLEVLEMPQRLMDSGFN